MFRSDINPSPELVRRLESELRSVARHLFARERADHTLQPTALVSEVWLRLATMDRYEFADVASFKSWAAGVMRKILVDHARRRNAEKRGGHALKFELIDEWTDRAPTADLAALDEAMLELARDHQRVARVVEMRFFGGMTSAEISRVLGISERTIRYDWEFARAWLRGRLEDAQRKQPA